MHNSEIGKQMLYSMTYLSVVGRIKHIRVARSGRGNQDEGQTRDTSRILHRIDQGVRVRVKVVRGRQNDILGDSLGQRSSCNLL